MFIKSINEKNKLISVAQIQDAEPITHKGGYLKNHKHHRGKGKSFNEELKKLDEQEEIRFEEDKKNHEFISANCMFFKVSVINEITSDPTMSVIKK